MDVKLSVLLCIKLIAFVDSSKILLVFPSYAPSHYLLGNALGRGLANVGHEVTLVSAFRGKNIPQNGTFKEVVLSGADQMFAGTDIPSWKELGDLNVVQNQFILNKIGNVLTNFTLGHPQFQSLLRSEEKFDVIILEQFINDGLKILSCHYEAPLISFSTLGRSSWTNVPTGNPAPPSYIPDNLLGYPNRMTLWERTVNTLTIIYRHMSTHLLFFPQQSQIVSKYFPECSKKSDEFLFNVSLTLINDHESLNDPVPSVPSMISIGGFHLVSPKKLPEELQHFLDSAKEGVVYFSFGSNIASSDIDNHTRDIFLRVLGKLKQKVLWKWDDADLPEKPGNVRIEKWIPQQDVLAHPNVKLFITHGGLLSIMETVYNGVPMLAIPFFGDQKMNAVRIKAGGYGLFIKVSDLSEQKLTNALEELLNNPMYRINAIERSKLMRDRPLKPMDLAIYWTEFVINHKGAPHLRIAGLDQAWYQYLLLDVSALIAALFISISCCFYLVFKCLRFLFKKSDKVKIN